MTSFLTHVRSYWRAWFVVALIWALALIRVLVDPTPRLPILFNISPSLPFVIVIADYSDVNPHRGDYVIYAYEGAAVAHFPGIRHQPLFKQIAGVEGDAITVIGRQVHINGRPVGYAKRRTITQLELRPITPMTIPAGYFYVAGVHPDSFDSRYAIGGLVARHQILARITPLL